MQGAAREQQLCNMQPCPVDGGWSGWSTWTSCNESCGAEFQERSRKCTQPAPSYGGKTCQGKAREEHLCNLSPCPVDGGWSDWSVWTSCEYCGSIQERSRTCTSPEPGFGGKPCAGEELETHDCEDLCDVDALGRRL
ncbi:Hemicentin-1 [Desmophyllum pertusum]|uniref:Hemicentin-1 n=1 Tax=Desmophyllum pertusum TaxID=174260 RepID=A0A9W9ZXL2_9CNID|nr:Hemicentin-1 [Desmophyllum pertusum]